MGFAVLYLNPDSSHYTKFQLSVSDWTNSGYKLIVVMIVETHLIPTLALGKIVAWLTYLKTLLSSWPNDVVGLPSIDNS